MIKRIFDIITFPFYLVFQFVSLPIKILKIIIDDKTEKRKNNDRTKLINTNQEELIEIGQYLYSDLRKDFVTFINSFLKDKKTFLAENKDLLSNYDSFELDKLKPIEAIYIFGDSKQKLFFTDWYGEENKREIENFLENKLQIKTDWKNVSKMRNGVDLKKQRDGKFIIELLKTIDKDLEPLNKRLILFDLGWDAYVYTAIDQTSYKFLIDRFDTLFHGTERLK